MIVCCPACQTQFNVDPALLGPDGRKVRCARCAHVWRVGRDGRPATTGQFGLRAPPAKTAEPAAAEAGGEAQAGANAPPEPASQEHTEGSDSSSPGAEETSLWAREIIEREKAAKQAAKPTESTDGADQGPQQTAAAKQAVHRARKKGGQTFRMFLLVLCLVVLALFAIAALTGRFGPGGNVSGPKAPTTGDVMPPDPGAATSDSKPGRAEGGGAQ